MHAISYFNVEQSIGKGTEISHEFTILILLLPYYVRAEAMGVSIDHSAWHVDVNPSATYDPRNPAIHLIPSLPTTEVIHEQYLDNRIRGALAVYLLLST